MQSSQNVPWPKLDSEILNCSSYRTGVGTRRLPLAGKETAGHCKEQVTSPTIKEAVGLPGTLKKLRGKPGAPHYFIKYLYS